MQIPHHKKTHFAPLLSMRKPPKQMETFLITNAYLEYTAIKWLSSPQLQQAHFGYNYKHKHKNRYLL